MGKFIDLTGERFGEYTVIKRVDIDKYKYKWLCKSDCGGYKYFTRDSLITISNREYYDIDSFKKSKLNTKDINEFIGKQFGELKVISYTGRNKHNQVMYLCECSCGNKKEISRYSLTSGNTQSCGCLKLGSYKVDYTGLRFGRLTVLCEYDKDRYGNVTWLCECECGNFTIVNGGNLTSGNTSSCGCLWKEKVSEAISGENHPNWNGGSSFFPYCEKFNNKKKEEIRNKYGNKCLICGKTKEGNKNRELSIHHVTYNKQDGCNGNGFKLIPLCTSCHSKTNFNRNFWEYYCKYLIKWYDWKHSQ